MVSKVGSAGHVIDSVIQYSQNTQGVGRQESAERREMRAPVKKSERIVEAAVVAGAEDKGGLPERAADVGAQKKGFVFENKPIQPVSYDAAELKDANGEVIEKRSDIELSEEALKITVDDVNKRITSSGARVEFSYHEKTRRYSFKVLDTKSGETIREFPPEKSLDMVAKMFEMVGLIVDEKL